MSICVVNFSSLKENIDFVICKICNFHSQNLGIHLKKIHNISSKKYTEIYGGNILSATSYNKYKLNGNEEILSEYIKNNLEDFSRKVSKGILNSSTSRKLHSDMMINLNNKQQADILFKKIVSDTAKKTSSRPEIIEFRTLKLKKWREENPDDFYNKCIKKMITAFQSKPEKKILQFVNNLSGFNFKKNQFINSKFISNKSHNKQMDMGDKEKRIYIEFDGVLHFLPKYGYEILSNIKQKDQEIEYHISSHNWTIIRISYDQFVYKTKMVNKIKEDASYFKQECLDNLIKILNENKPGIYKIGEAYGKY